MMAGYEIEVAYAAAALIGVFAGWFSYAHQALFVGALGLGGASVGVVLKLGTSAGDLLTQLPVAGQNLAAICFFAALAGRILTWKRSRRPQREESHAQRRARILADYGMEDPLKGMGKSKLDPFAVAAESRQSRTTA